MMTSDSFSTVGRNAGGIGLRRPAAPALQILVIALLTALPSWNARGAPATADQAKSAVQGWLRTDARPFHANLGTTTGKVTTYNDDDGAPLYHVVSLDPNGFVIVAADDLVEPVVAFSSSGNFDPSPDTPLGAMVSKDLPNRMSKVKGLVRGKAQGVHLAARSKWDQLAANAGAATRQVAGGDIAAMSASASNAVSDLRVAPLTQTTWDQSLSPACYNYYTPPYAAGSVTNYVCGCVATAMAQLMKYWQYPLTAVNKTTAYTITYTDPNTGSTITVPSTHLRGGSGTSGAYNWSLLITNPASGSTLAQRQEIGALCVDAGTSVKMSYAPSGSGASLGYSPSPLKSAFYYSNAIVGMAQSNGWNAMINPNLDAGCPVLLGISNSSEGHAIVCDGYGYNLSTLYHHMNMGWSGYDNIWYNLPAIDMFTSVDTCIYNVWTNGTGEIISGRVADGLGNGVMGAGVTAIRAAGGTYTATTDVHGIYAFVRIPSSSQYTISINKSGYFNTTTQTVSTALSADYGWTSGNKWGVNFALGTTNDPAGLAATPVSVSEIDLSWVKNASNDNVLVAWNTVNAFGTPTGSYAIGNQISGGGTVLYNGSGTSAPHTGLTGKTMYYYKAWSVHAGTTYSPGVACSANTGYGIPFSEGFECGTLPNDWTQEYVNTPFDWVFTNGSPVEIPSTAAHGNYNACFCDLNLSGIGFKTKLVTPAINIGNATQNAQLTFNLCMENYDQYQDKLNVYYKTSAAGAWTLLQTYASAVSSWTPITLPLPNVNGSYYIAFEGDNEYGDGICIDDVQVTGTAGAGMTNQTIGGFAPPATALTTNVIALSATASSGLAVSYTATIPGYIIGNSVIFSNAGSVTVVASQAGNASWNAAPSLTNTISVIKATAPITLTPSTLSQTYNGSARIVAATTVPAGLQTNITYNGSVSAPTNPGSYTVVGSVSASEPLYQGSVTGTLVVAKATATLTLTPSTLTQTYNGSARIVTATTVPAGLQTNITYNGSVSAPTNPGSYTVVGSVSASEPLYQGSVTGTLVVAKATATVTLTPSTLTQTYNGSARIVTATTVPAGLQTNITYNGSGTPPTEAGNYTMLGTVSASEPLYQGSASGTLVVIPASQTISGFPNPGNQAINNTVTLNATASSLLAVSYSLAQGGGIAAINASTLSFSGTGAVSIVASQSGNADWYAAPSLTNTFTVTNTLARGALTFYVATNGSDAANGLAWATARQTIQGAVNLTQAGDTVLVSNGVYATGGGIAPTLSGSNRVVITNNITVQSVNGAAVTIIKGLKGGTYSQGDSVRCVYMINGGTLSGFTLTNGCTASGSWDDCGGGINFGAVFGGGGPAGTGGTALNCVITGCAAKWGGGGVIYGTLVNCLVTGNSTPSTAGGAYAVNMVNCTVAGNSAGASDGGTYGGALNNCIVYSNSAPNYPNRDDGCTFNNSCTTPAAGGTGNITSNPQFVNAAAGNFRLQATSPCIGTGNNAYVTTNMTADLDGNSRIINGTVDMGAYECAAGTSTVTTVTVAAIGDGTASGGGNYQAGSSVGISALATNGHWFFSVWNDGNTNAARTIIVPLTNITYTATFTQNASALTFYVATNGSDAADGRSWATAKQTIQGGIDQTLIGDTVLVSNGVYATGGKVPTGYALTNRVVFSGITLRSVNGAGVTTISGAINSPAATNGDAAVRCAYLGANAVLSGFTLTNSHTRGLGGDLFTELRGGAVYCTDVSDVVSNCIVTGSSACSWGGGAEGGTFYNCLFTGNWAGQGGGGADSCVLNNCTIVGNTGVSAYGGGVEGGTVNNCIVFFNNAPSGANIDSATCNYTCSTPVSGVGGIGTDPMFVNAAAANYHLQATSPCLRQGSTNAAGGTDLDGNPRVVNGRIDLGAYEAQGGGGPYLLTSSSGAGGVITPASTNASAGSSAVFHIQGNVYQRIVTLTTNGVSVGVFSNNSTSTNFIWSNVQAGGTLYATFTDQVTSDPGHPTYTWLATHGLATDTNGTNGSCSDTDHDGLTAWQEYLAGTDPTNAASVLSLRSITTGSGSNIIRWSSSALARAPYNVLYSTNLTSGVWTLYTNNIAPTPPTNSLIIPRTGSSPTLFYKVTITN